MSTHQVRGTVARFEGENGWFYLPLSKKLCALLRPRVSEAWPALVKAKCKTGKTEWAGTIMPIKDGPLFISLPAKVRKAAAIEVGQRITVRLEI